MIPFVIPIRKGWITAMGTDSRGGKQNIDFLGHFGALENPRQPTKVVYPLDEILHLSLCATLSGADSWVELAAIGSMMARRPGRGRPRRFRVM